MGINPYGLFSGLESNNSSGSDYELRRQLQARQSQLEELSRKQSLSDADNRKREQLNNAISQLSGRLERRNNPGQSSVPDNAVTRIPSNNNQSVSKPSNNPYTQNFTEGTVLAKSPYKAPSAADNVSSDYLKGFFLDIKI